MGIAKTYYKELARRYENIPWLGILGSLVQSKPSGPRLNIKTVLSTYGDFHVKDKTS